MAKQPQKTAPPKTIVIDLQPSPEAGEGRTLVRQALEVSSITNREQHAAALEFVRGAKQLLRKVNDHWTRITRAVDDHKRNLLTLKREDTEPIERAIQIVTDHVTNYDNERARIEREEQDRIRKAAEQKAADDRARELAEREAAALKAEAESPTLSARETTFVDQMVAGAFSAARCAQIAGYKDPEAAGARLMASDKIKDAIHAKRTAAHIREQAAAAAKAPLQVNTPKVQSERAKVAGVRSTTYYSAEGFNLQLLVDAIAKGDVDLNAVQFNETWLNAQARQIQDEATFNAGFPGVRLVKRQGLAG